jgi:hypothetical protein
MFTKWYSTDNGCHQHMRKDGRVYEMIQCVWLDTTEEDRLLGRHEYVIVRGDVDMSKVTMFDVKCALAAYGYNVNDLANEYGYVVATDIIAECILEEEIVRDSCIIDVADTFKEAKEKIDKIINENN